MQEAIGQSYVKRGGAPGVREDEGLTYAERKAVRSQRLRPAFNEAIVRLREAERERDLAADELATAATRLLLGEATEEEVAEVEHVIEQSERLIRRWKAAARSIDGERGVVRDSNGTILR